MDTKSRQVVYSPRSLARVLGALETLARSPTPMTLAELSGALASPKSSMLLLLRPLVARGFLAHAGKGYQLGPASFRLASEILAIQDAGRSIRPHLEELARRTQESVCLARLDLAAGEVTYVDSIDSPQAVRFTIRTGLSRPLYCTAAGRLLLAYRDSEWREAYLRRARIRAITPHTVTDRDAIRRELDKIRKERVSLSIDEIVPGSAAMAAPVFDANGEVTTALVIGAPIERFRRHLPTLRKCITLSAARASAGRTGAAP
jgi:DNA-binding IclR family transcriptional regulator